MQVLKHLKSRRLTKKECKKINGMNAATKMSMNASKQVMNDGTQYHGENPIYRNVAAPHELVNFLKIRAGIPFVRPALFGA